MLKASVFKAPPTIQTAFYCHILSPPAVSKYLKQKSFRRLPFGRQPHKERNSKSIGTNFPLRHEQAKTSRRRSSRNFTFEPSKKSTRH